jgi:competence protein ComEA
MKSSFVTTLSVAAALLLSATPSFAAASKPDAAAAPKAKASAAAGQVKKGKATSVKPVDINSASKAELMKLPGISGADADKIIAGRPYLSKAHLVTRNIIAEPVYQSLKTVIFAKQKDTPKPKKSQGAR